LNDIKVLIKTLFVVISIYLGLQIGIEGHKIIGFLITLPAEILIINAFYFQQKKIIILRKLEELKRWVVK